MKSEDDFVAPGSSTSGIGSVFGIGLACSAKLDSAAGNVAAGGGTDSSSKEKEDDEEGALSSFCCKDTSECSCANTGGHGMSSERSG
jgi:hypothetical protein